MRPDLGRAQALVDVARQLAVNGQVEEALHGFQSALLVLPMSCEVQHNIGTALANMRRKAEAIHSWHFCPGFPPSSSARRDEAARQAEEAGQLVANGRLEDAAAAFTLATRALPFTAEHHAALAQVQEMLGRATAARRAYEQALSITPRLGTAYVGLGRLALQHPSSAHHSAVPWLQRATELIPEQADAWFLLGTAEVQASDRSGGAVNSLRRAAHLRPLHADTHWMLGDALALRGQRQQALRSLVSAVRLAPRHIEAYSTLARIVGYEVSSSRGARLALRCYRAALLVHPSHFETLHNLGEHLQVILTRWQPLLPPPWPPPWRSLTHLLCLLLSPPAAYAWASLPYLLPPALYHPPSTTHPPQACAPAFLPPYIVRLTSSSTMRSMPWLPCRRRVSQRERRLPSLGRCAPHPRVV